MKGWFQPARGQGLARAGCKAAMLVCALVILLPMLASCSSGERRAATEDPRRPLTQAEISAVQSILSKRGYDPGPVDGMMGPKTARAIAAYQKDKGLKPDGLATAALIRHLQQQPDTAPEVVKVEAAAPVGLYPPGTRLVFDAGEVHTVKSVKAGRLHWETSLGESYVAGPHFGLPEYEWQSGTWKGVAESTLPPATSWPPSRGMDIYFDVTVQEWNQAEGKSPHRLASETSWVCGNRGTRPVTVPAGAFTAQAIQCERSPAPAGAWQRRVWYYVPSIGHFVRRQDFDGAGMEIGELDLVAILPVHGSPTLEKGLEGALFDSLDRARPGQASVWRNPRGGEVFLIRVGEVSKGPGGETCRTYIVAQRDVEPAREYPALACRISGKHGWGVPGVK